MSEFKRKGMEPVNKNQNTKPKNPKKKVPVEVLKNVLEHLGLFCSKCGAPRTTTSVNILGQAPNGVVAHVSCKNCNAQEVFHVVANVGSSSAGGFVTDVRMDEANKFFKSEGVSRDDVLDVHILIQETIDASGFVQKLNSRRDQKSVSVQRSFLPIGPGVSATA